VNVTTAGSMASMNRGTEEHIVQLGEEITAENILPPGNGGYVAPDGSTGEHFNDQLQMFKNFEYKPLRFDDDTVDSATETTQDLLFQVEEVEDEDGTDDGTNNGTDGGGDNGTDDGTNNGTDGGGDNGTDDGTNNGTDGGGDNGADDASGPGFSAVTGVAAVLSSALYWLHSREEDNEP
jgi:penicillin amidase